ncbi:hypothetical protein [Acinetobacter sp. CFCC 11171]|uniref:hypothetical protein n=1 Tax=Acinetobacter sp. CFCC 11171 TaxID=1775558 RepID=UPI0013A6E727|nr:hypothetical protein [Acinetobacter sp. CFCC 11171]
MGQLYRSQGQFKDQITDKQQAHANAGNQRLNHAKRNAQSVSKPNTPSFCIPIQNLTVMPSGKSHYDQKSLLICIRCDCHLTGWL